MSTRVCIVCIAKREREYILEFIHYHICLGFDKIILYDNEDVPTYQKLIIESKPSLLPFTRVIHFPTRDSTTAVQYAMLDHFMGDAMKEYTHAMHIDVDEFLVLKKHTDIKSFIHEWIEEDLTCAGVGFNWKFFGSSDLRPPLPGYEEYSDFSQVMRFLKCQTGLNSHIKTLFKTDEIMTFRTVHDVRLKSPSKYIKSADSFRKIIEGPHYETNDDSIAQLNHYKTKTWAEFRYIWSRGTADFPLDSELNKVRLENDMKAMRESFDKHDRNECIDTGARDFYVPFLKNDKIMVDKSVLVDITGKKIGQTLCFCEFVQKCKIYIDKHDLWAYLREEPQQARPDICKRILYLSDHLKRLLCIHIDHTVSMTFYDFIQMAIK